MMAVRLIFLLLSLTFLSGCWDYSSLENKFIIHTVGIDVSERNPGMIEVTAMGVTFQSSNESLHGEGRSIVDALRAIREHTEKTIAVSHLQAVLVSDRLARKNMMPYMDMFYRDAQVRSDAMMLVVEGKTADYMQKEKLRFPVDGRFLQSLVNQSEIHISDHEFDIQNVMFAMEQNENCFALPYLKYDRQQKVIHYQGVALFNDGAMSGSFGLREATAFYMLRGSMKRTIYTMGELKLGERSAKSVTFRLFGPKRDVKLRMKNGKPEILVELRFKDEILEINPWLKRKLSSVELEQLIEELEADIRRQCRKMLLFMQEQQRLELFGFRNLARVKWSAGYKTADWHRQFAEIPVQVKVDVKLERTGVLY